VAAHGENLSFGSYARNKKGITLDLSKRGGDEVLRDLLGETDVVLHNYSPGAARAMGLTYEELSAIKPDIILTAVSCYGADGPYADRVGFDPIAQCMSGATSFGGFEDDPPMRSQLPWVDYSTGLCAAIGTLLAIRHRDKTGEGQAVDLALLQTAVSFTAPMIAEATILGRERPKIGNRTAYVGPSDMFKCKDGHVYVSVIMDGMWKRLMRVVGHEEFIDDPDFDSDLNRFENRERVDPRVQEWIAGHTVAEVVAAMEEARIPCAESVSTGDVADDPHIQHRKMLEYVDLGHPGLEKVPVSGIPIKLSKTPGEVRDRAPHVGEHNGDFYGDKLGYSDAKIAELKEREIL